MAIAGNLTTSPDHSTTLIMPEFLKLLARKLRLGPIVKRYIASLFLMALAIGARADLIQLTTGKTLSGRVTSYANDAFELQPTNATPVKVPANSVTTIDFPSGAVKATVEVDGQEPLAGTIWLYARGTLSFDGNNGESTKIPLAKISRVSFSAEPIPERPAPPPRPKSVRAPAASPYAAAKVEVISHGEEVDIQKHCVSGKITIVDFYADWCGPCKQAGPILEELVSNDSDLVLRKIDIVKWTSPVSQQFGLHGIPYIQVYDRRGNKVGDMSGFNKATLETYLSRARQ
jgi:thioredoxin 1